MGAYLAKRLLKMKCKMFLISESDDFVGCKAEEPETGENINALSLGIIQQHQSLTLLNPHSAQMESNLI